MQHDDAFSCQGAVKDACDAITTFNPKLEKPVTESTGMRFSEIAAVYLHAFNKMLVSGTHTQWKLVDLQPDLFTVVFDSVVHELKHNKMVMFAQYIDSAISGRYTVSAPYKAGAGIGTPELHTAIFDAPASFLSSTFTHARIMVGWAGEPKGSPVSVCAGSSNPVQSATSELGTSGGGSYPLHTEAAIMATIPTLTQPEIAIVDGQVVTSSLAVADFFSKRHDDVLKKIRILDCSPEFCARNFAETSILVHQPNGGTRKLPCYHITRDGFAFLAMGFTGKRAARFKEAYINAFNLMEKSLSGADASDMSAVARNARGVYLHLREIHQIWTSQLYPMLKAVESPLASKLYDRVGDAVFGAALVDSRLNGSDKEAHP